MNKTTSGHLCVTCNQRFSSSNGLEKHMEEKHMELWCDICGKLFRNRREFTNHMDQCEQLSMEAVECDKSQKSWFGGDQKGTSANLIRNQYLVRCAKRYLKQSMRLRNTSQMSTETNKTNQR